MSASTPRRPTLIEAGVLLEDDRVRILDRRVFPFERTYVDCLTYEDVARAIEDMVTQSGGPFLAATAALVLAAQDAAGRGLSPEKQREHLAAAAARLIETRRTNGLIATAMEALMRQVDDAVREGREDLTEVVRDAVRHEWALREESSSALGRYAADLIPDGARILTHCWGESVVIATFEALQASGKSFSLTCTETRPYLQGARLTAESAAEMGIPTRVITDGMGASVMNAGAVDLLLTAADRVTADGFVVNKVGTLQLALAAAEFNLPYYALVREPDLSAVGAESVPLEDRNPDEVLHCLGVRTASWKVEGYYPAFDVTPPRLVTKVVTELGAFAPADLGPAHSEGQARVDEAGRSSDG